MKFQFPRLHCATIAIALLFAGAGSVLAAEAKLGSLMLEQPWARATPGQAKNGAAYLTIHNAGKADDRLLSAASDVAARVELHNHVNKDGVMQMRQVEAVAVPAGGMTTLKPGGLHVMLMGLKGPLKEGESFPLTLTFEQAGSTTVQVKVESVGSMGSMSGKAMEKIDHGSMDHGGMDHGKSATTN